MQEFFTGLCSCSHSRFFARRKKGIELKCKYFVLVDRLTYPERGAMLSCPLSGKVTPVFMVIRCLKVIEMFSSCDRLSYSGLSRHLRDVSVGRW